MAHGGVFLNIEKNRQKMGALALSEGKHADAMIGLAEFSQEPFIEGREVISLCEASFTPGIFPLRRTAS